MQRLMRFLWPPEICEIDFRGPSLLESMPVQSQYLQQKFAHVSKISHFCIDRWLQISDNSRGRIRFRMGRNQSCRVGLLKWIQYGWRSVPPPLILENLTRRAIEWVGSSRWGCGNCMSIAIMESSGSRFELSELNLSSQPAFYLG